MLKKVRPSFLLGALALLSVTAGATPLKGDEATITSDEMELVEHGQKTIFEGHVVLQRSPYELKAHRMIRTQDKGLIDVEGNIRITWRNPEGGQVEVKGDKGRYNPDTQLAELWTKSPRQVIVEWKDAQGTARFYSQRAEFDGANRTVRLVERVTGHVVPAPR